MGLRGWRGIRCFVGRECRLIYGRMPETVGFAFVRLCCWVESKKRAEL